MNINWKLRKYTKEEFIFAWNNSNSVHDCLMKLNLRVSSYNYNSAKKAAFSLGLSTEEPNFESFCNKKTKRDFLLSLDSEYKCDSCGITEWSGKSITLQLDHIDGDSKNNIKDNLRILCPNCHSQTETYSRPKNSINRICTKKGCKEKLHKQNSGKYCQNCKYIENSNIKLDTFNENKFNVFKEFFIQIWNTSERLSEVALKIGGSKKEPPYIRKMGFLLGLKPFKNGYRTCSSIERLVTSIETSNHLSSNHRKLIRENILENLCSICGITEYYNGKPITLHVDHIDGNWKNNKIANLRLMCYNCHTQTKTWGNKPKPKSNKKCEKCHKPIFQTSIHCNSCSKSLFPTKQYRKNGTLIVSPTCNELKDALLKFNGNFKSIGKHYSVSDNSIRNWCRKYNLPTNKKEMKVFLSQSDPDRTRTGDLLFDRQAF